MRVVAVIPARGGSKGVPNKNIRPVGGVPLVGRSIIAALESETVGGVYVSTDDVGIAAVSTAFGASVIQRPAEISGDTASSEAALLHALDHMPEQPDVLVFLQCTSPFTTPAQIDAVVRKLIATDADCCFAAAEDHGFLWQENGEDAVGVNHDHTQPRKRRQELTPTYRETGSIYALRVTAFREKQQRFCGKTVLAVVDQAPLEIDTPDELRWCDAIAWTRKENVPLKPRLEAIKALVFDFDGVMTDDHVTVSETGEESVRCSRSDGMGITLLKEKGLKLFILSKEKNPVVLARAKKLGIPAQNSTDSKLPALQAWAAENGVSLSEIAYMGNDVNDVEVMGQVGLAIAPADAHPSAKAVAHYITAKDGGKGAVREVCDWW
ncbi:MAG: N-acylneuraminate cytidylyltransferase [Alphaproteobacteria bacterium]|nr:N-acylneuraminate cytidylyltransferase [Alphaproteobacteria bacterium]